MVVKKQFELWLSCSPRKCTVSIDGMGTLTDAVPSVIISQNETRLLSYLKHELNLEVHSLQVVDGEMITDKGTIHVFYCESVPGCKYPSAI